MKINTEKKHGTTQNEQKDRKQDYKEKAWMKLTALLVPSTRSPFYIIYPFIHILSSHS